MFEALEEKLKPLWHRVDGEARAEMETALNDVKQRAADLEERAAKVMPLLGAFKADMAQALTAAEPAVKTAAEGLLAKLEADATALLGEAAKSV